VDELLWKCPPDVAGQFTHLLEMAEMGRTPVEETIDLVRSLPGFPLEWTPGRPVRMVISHPVPKPMIQMPR
jgi:hypothetical protein